MNALDRIKRAKVAIMRHKKFCAYSGILACGPWVIDDSIPTACTSGWGASFNSEFVQSLTDSELRLLILHEATHVAYRHMVVWKALHEENPMLANVAADHFVNLALIETDAMEGFIKMPEKGIQPDKQYHGMSVKQIYDLLKQEQEKRGGDGGDGGEGGAPGDEEGEGEGGGLDGHDWKGAKEGEGKDGGQEGERRDDEIKRAIRQGEMLVKKIGKGAGDANGVFGDLLVPKVDWKKVLREFVTEYCAGRDESSWRKPNRRFLADDVYMPSMVGTTLDELVIGFDTSGSCFNSAEMTRFVTEVASIIETVKPSKVHVAYVDTRVAGMQTFEDGQFAVQNIQPKGGGGTHLPVLFDYLAEKNIKPTCLVYLTDGYSDFDTAPDYPVLWAMTTNIKAPYGTTIQVEV